ncbi:MAG: hypothetical protein Q7S22_00325 [Candidatus Micrarchaeota archaeon]|nr:hypothetical protein [Candidatus Micrarchaeota archaeon]
MVDQNRVIVDDALISTDVDRLIRIISSKRTLDISELQKSTGIERRTMDKWLKVLEDEGYVKMDYRITNTYIMWLGYGKTEEDSEIVDAEPVDKDTYATNTIVTTQPPELKSEIVPTLPSSNETFKQNEPTTPEIKDKQDMEEIKEHIIEEIKNDEEVITDDQVNESELPTAEPISEPQVMQKPEIKILDKYERKEEKTKMRNMVSSYLEEIGRQKTEIANLKQKKEIIYTNRYADIESRVEAELATVTERILEKENRILELKERVLELPDKVEELEKMHEAITKVEADGKEVIKRTRNKVENLITELNEAENYVRSHVEETRGTIEAQNKKLDDISNIEQALDTRMEKIKETLNITSEKLQEMTATMQGMFGELQDASRMKTEVAEIANNLRGSMDQREEELVSLEDELSDIRKVEEWVKEYLKDYEQKIDEVEEYIRGSDEEMNKLREASEKEYIKKYVRELQDLTNIYEQEMDGAARDEKDIERKIIESKRRLEELVGESKDMLSKLMKETSDVEDFSSVNLRARNKIANIRGIINEKEKERDRLSEDSKAVKEKRKNTKPLRQSTKDSKNSKDKKGKK